MKKIIETWRYIIFYHYNEEDARLFYNNDSNYKKPDSTKLNTKVDSCIKDFEIHIYEDESILFYKDFIRKYYEELCAFSHLDIFPLKATVLDREANINLFINAHKEILNRLLVTILILQRLLCELYAKIFDIKDSEFITYYKTCVANLNAICDT